jgi:mono/diheme cytochrome c family protein
LTNKQRTIAILMSLATAGLLFGCDREAPNDNLVPGRWYTATQVAEGGGLYQTHCAVCHGASAAATEDWRTTDENGVYPPPPLNGTAHAWHHPMPILEQTIANGGVALGGAMPGFRDTLDSSEARATIAFFQSFWSDDIYASWNEINNR